MNIRGYKGLGYGWITGRNQRGLQGERNRS
jgi:hypothetical protein